MPTKLRALIDTLSVVGSNLTAAVRESNDWHGRAGSAESFVITSIFFDLQAKGWDDEQGVPAHEYSDFEANVLPRSKSILDSVIAGTQVSQQDLDELVQAYPAPALPSPIIVRATP